MEDRLHPLDGIEDSLEAYLGRFAQPVDWIYRSTAALVAVLLAALPLVRVGITVQADGLIRPALEKHEVIPEVSGRVERVHARLGSTVAAGDTLLVLDPGALDERLAVLRQQIEDVEARLRDVTALLAPGDEIASTAAAVTPLYRAQHRLVRDELSELDSRVREAERSVARSRLLAASGSVAPATLEADEFTLTRLRSERSALLARRRAGLQEELVRLGAEGLELRGRAMVLEAERASLTIRAPASGSVVELTPLSPGSVVQAGRPFAVISPDEDLVAEVYLAPRQVGLVEPGTPARVLVDAFRYSDWGYLTGHVAALSGDIVPLGEAPVFPAVIRLDHTSLGLRNGVRREVQKGMTVRARFLIAERSLWQLLRDDVNDWLNPVLSPA